jgi:hypothetical protein
MNKKNNGLKICAIKLELIRLAETQVIFILTSERGHLSPFYKLLDAN